MGAENGKYGNRFLIHLLLSKYSNMKKVLVSITLLIAFVQFQSCTKTIIKEVPADGTSGKSTDWTTGPEFVITDYGAKGDGKNSCTWVFKKILNMMPADGGTIVIPHGAFLLDTPIVIDRNFVTIRGYNEGLRSNIDAAVSSLINPGGGSKLILGNADTAITVRPLPPSQGRLSGLTIKNLLISGGATGTIKGVGIGINHDNDGIKLSDIVCINLNTGIYANAADAMTIQSSWVSECRRSIFMENGIQNMISNCLLGAIPNPANRDYNNTVLLKNQENFVFNGNHVYPDGDVNLKIENGQMVNVTGNNFQSYYVGMIEVINSMNNLISNNIFWMRDPNGNASWQLRNKTNDYGVIRISGLNNMVSNSSFFTDWVNASNNPVVVRVHGSQGGNSFQNLKFAFQNSSRIFYVTENNEIVNCVSPDKITVDGDRSKVRIVY